MSRRPVQTSANNPLRIDAVAVAGGGEIGMTICPGKQQPGGLTGHWQRDLGADIDRIRDWGAVAVVTLMEAEELARFGVAGMAEAVAARGMAWLHLPIVDVDIPRAPFEAAWPAAGPRLQAWLTEGRRILLHCRGGLGRTGTIAARLLVERGMAPEAAIEAVRAARPGTIETPSQLAHVRGLRPPGG